MQNFLSILYFQLNWKYPQLLFIYLGPTICLRRCRNSLKFWMNSVYKIWENEVKYIVASRTAEIIYKFLMRTMFQTKLNIQKNNNNSIFFNCYFNLIFFVSVLHRNSIYQSIPILSVCLIHFVCNPNIFINAFNFVRERSLEMWRIQNFSHFHFQFKKN